MGDLESLLLVLAALYLAECVAWVRRGSVAFINWSGLAATGWRLHHPGATIANQHGAVLMLNPFPPLGSVIFGQQPPLSLSADAALAYSAACLNPAWRPDQTSRLVRFDDMKQIECNGRTVLVNGELFLKAMSPFVARRVGKWLREIKDTPAAQRNAAIQHALAESFDEKKIRQRLEEFRAASQPLRVLSNSLFAYLYVLVPIVILRYQLTRFLWPMLGLLFAHTISIALFFWRAHGRLFPGGDAERFTPFLTMLLAPPSAARANDALGKHLLEDFHALAVGQVLLPPEAFRAFARRVLLDLRHPMFPICAAQDPLAMKTEELFRRALREVAENLVTRSGLNLEELLKSLPRSEPAHAAYCQRCDAQFVTSDGVCNECGGRPLEKW
jgi:hypothetical protein